VNKVIQPPRIIPNFFIFIVGFILRIINKIRHSLIGYTSPRPFSSAQDMERSVVYTLKVVRDWEEALKRYLGSEFPFKNKHVLELCPGPDLGTGLVILALGAQSYTAIDKYKLISRTPLNFYRALFRQIEDFPAFEKAQKALPKFQEQGSCEDCHYIYDPCFSLNNLSPLKYDILVSQAVLEHLDDVSKTFKILKAKLSIKSIMVHEVDLGTHTRWIRKADPLNLLRYSDRIYELLKFGGSPNRLRISDYRRILAKLGFANIEARPLVITADEYIKKVRSALNKRFRCYAPKELRVTSFQLLASKPENTDNGSSDNYHI
jgi:hypothetical protein